METRIGRRQRCAWQVWTGPRRPARIANPFTGWRPERPELLIRFRPKETR